jgi:hypothetical protein
MAAPDGEHVRDGFQNTGSANPCLRGGQIVCIDDNRGRRAALIAAGVAEDVGRR